MRSTWLGLGLGMLTLIGCNALWQGYLSPIDDPLVDASVDELDLSGADLTGVPPPDLTGADFTGVSPPDLIMPPKPCGLTTAKSSVFSYSTYATAIPLGSLSASKLAVMDIDKDGLAEVAVSTTSSPVKVFKLSGAAACTFGAATDCIVNDAIADLRGLSIDGTAGAFVVARSNASANAISTCTGIPINHKTITDMNFASNSPRRELTVPPLKSNTNGIFILHEKSSNSSDRVNSVQLNATAGLVSTVMLANLTINGNFEPRNATGARIDDAAPDGTLDVITLEVNGSMGRMRAYNNNHAATPATPKGTATLTANFADLNRITSARLSNDSFDDAVVIVTSTDPPQIVPHIISAGGIITPKSPITINIPVASADRSKLMFTDLDADGIDELIAINGTNVSIYAYNTVANTLSAPRNLAVRATYSAVAIALGYAEKNLSSGPPDIFVIANSGSTNEVGVFRWMP